MERLQSHRDFVAVLKRRRKVGGKDIIVQRRFRVLAKAHEESLPPYCDIVVRAKPSAASASFSSLDEQFATGFAKVARKAE